MASFDPEKLLKKAFEEGLFNHFNVHDNEDECNKENIHLP